MPAPTATAQPSPPTVAMAFIEGGPATLDPQAADSLDEFLVLRNVYEGLVSYDPKTLQPTPGLAERWDISSDGLTYTFHLRQGVKFQNGRAVTAKDVKYSLERLANPKTGTSYTRLLLNSVIGIDAVQKGTATETEGLKVVDDQTFEITLNNPVASFLNQLTLPGGFVVPQEAADQKDFGQKPVGTGPYKFVQWVPKGQINLEVNADYWGSAPKVKYVVLRIIPDSLKQVSEFRANMVDITVVPAFQLPQLQSDANLSPLLVKIPTFAVSYLIINLKDPALSKPEVRRALNMAIDRAALLKSVLKGQGSEAQGMIPPLLSAYDSDLPFKHDVDAAKQLLAQAGYDKGLKLEVVLATDETDKRIMGVIQSQLAEAGVDLTINSTEKKNFDALRKICKGQLFLSTWTGDYADPDDYTTLLIDSSAVRAKCGYGEYPGVADVKALLSQGTQMLPGADRDAIYRKAQKIAMDNAIVIPIYFRSRTALISSKLDGAYVSATLLINFADISIKQ